MAQAVRKIIEEDNPKPSTLSGLLKNVAKDMEMVRDAYDQLSIMNASLALDQASIRAIADRIELQRRTVDMAMKKLQPILALFEIDVEDEETNSLH